MLVLKPSLVCLSPVGRGLNSSIETTWAGMSLPMSLPSPPGKEWGQIYPLSFHPRMVLPCLNYPQAVVQAGEHRHSIEREIAVLIIHGVLHLLGYDHEEKEPEHRMRAREAELLGRIEGGLD